MCVELSIPARAKQLRKYRSHLKAQQNRISKRKQFNANIILIKFTLRSHYESISISIPWNGFTFCNLHACISFALNHVKHWRTHAPFVWVLNSYIQLSINFAGNDEDVSGYRSASLRKCSMSPALSSRLLSQSSSFLLRDIWCARGALMPDEKMQNLINFRFCWLTSATFIAIYYIFKYNSQIN